MAKKSDTVHDNRTRTARKAQGAGGSAAELREEPDAVVMRDESDEIIDDLKRQLAALQTELSAFKDEEPEPAGGGPGAKARKAARKGSRARLVHEFNAEFAPHLAQRLHRPAEELTRRLTALIEQVNDPDLKKELEQARETAFFLSSTFHRIQDNHRLLTESLVAERIELPVAEFFEQVARNVEQGGLPRPGLMRPEVTAPGAAEARMIASPLAAGTVLATLAELAGAVFGGDPRMTMGHGTPSHLRLRVDTGRPWHGIVTDDVSSVVFRPGVRATSVVDVLYIEKIIELQGGRLSFFREGGQVIGFEVLWPLEAQ